MCRYIVGIGEILWDMLPSGKMLGGAPANFAHNAERLGQPSVAISAIGSDAEGDQIIEAIKFCDFQRNDYPTGMVNVVLDAQGIPTPTGRHSLRRGNRNGIAADSGTF